MHSSISKRKRNVKTNKPNHIECSFIAEAKVRSGGQVRPVPYIGKNVETRDCLLCLFVVTIDHIEWRTEQRLPRVRVHTKRNTKIITATTSSQTQTWSNRCNHTDGRKRVLFSFPPAPVWSCVKRSSVGYTIYLNFTHTYTHILIRS